MHLLPVQAVLELSYEMRQLIRRLAAMELAVLQVTKYQTTGLIAASCLQKQNITLQRIPLPASAFYDRGCQLQSIS